MAMKVSKVKTMVQIYTDNRYKITGNIYIVENARITDALDAAARQSQFLPVTDAVVVFPDGTRKDEKFLLVRFSAIEILYLIEE